MAEEFNWCSSSRSSHFLSSPSSLTTNDAILFQDFQKTHHQQIITTTYDWTQDFLHDNGKMEENYYNILQGNGDFYSDMNCRQQKKVESQDSVINSSSYTSSLLRTLFDGNFDESQLRYEQTMNQVGNTNGFLPGLPKVIPSSTVARQHFDPLSFFPSINPPSLDIKKPNLPTFIAKHQNGTVKGLSSMSKKISNGSPIKRQRIETPSPLPTFKVRKEKMGDRITALQQLVSPFGKTDTASVLHEAIEYIKFLQDQLTVLSSPYFKNGSPPLQSQQQDELKSLGLCLVPISSTFPDADTDIWTPIFGERLKSIHYRK